MFYEAKSSIGISCVTCLSGIMPSDRAPSSERKMVLGNIENDQRAWRKKKHRQLMLKSQKRPNFYDEKSKQTSEQYVSIYLVMYINLECDLDNNMLTLQFITISEEFWLIKCMSIWIRQFQREETMRYILTTAEARRYTVKTQFQGRYHYLPTVFTCGLQIRTFNF
nr:unnamed protein product [Callosobruchus chinensis]